MSLTVRKLLVRVAVPVVMVAALAATAGTVRAAQAQPDVQAAAGAPADAVGGESTLVPWG